MKYSIPLDQITVASPCKVSWDTMVGDDRVRFCGQCQQRVYNLSALSAADAQAVVDKREEHLCVHFFRRFDGTMMTKDCPVGLRAIERRFTMIAGGIVALIVAALGLGAFVGNQGRTMGAICIDRGDLHPAAPVAPEEGILPREVKQVE